MKKLLLLLVIFPMLLISCSKDPMADFSISATSARIGETIYFTNRSIDAESFEWDFGDGFVSNSFNASHFYDMDGVYTVRLIAINRGQQDVITRTVTVIRDLFSDFSVSSQSVGIREDIFFTNLSTDAERFEWDFGDGYTSSSLNPSHYYDYEGSYDVVLKAFYQNDVDIAHLTVSVIGASIEITVEEYYTPFYLVPDISVILYASINDWENPETAPIVAEGYSNAAGVVVFDHLAPQRYYVDVWGPNHDNYKLATEDVGFIETPILVPGTITPWTALVDYYADGKKSGLSRAGTKALRKIEAAGQVHRVPGDRK